MCKDSSVTIFQTAFFCNPILNVKFKFKIGFQKNVV